MIALPGLNPSARLMSVTERFAGLALPVLTGVESAARLSLLPVGVEASAFV